MDVILCVFIKKFISKRVDMKSFGHTMTMLSQIRNGKKGHSVASTFKIKSRFNFNFVKTQFSFIQIRIQIQIQIV